MTGERKIYTSGGAYIERDYRKTNNQGTYVEGNYYNSPQDNKTIAVVAKEVQDLLTYFEQNNPPVIEAMQTVKAFTERQPELNNAKTIEAAIKATPTLKQRLHSAGKATYLETVKALLPPVGVAIEAIKAWNNPD